MLPRSLPHFFSPSAGRCSVVGGRQQAFRGVGFSRADYERPVDRRGDVDTVPGNKFRAQWTIFAAGEPGALLVADWGLGTRDVVWGRGVRLGYVDFVEQTGGQGPAHGDGVSEDVCGDG
jgi:hypothetical protein